MERGVLHGCKDDLSRSTMLPWSKTRVPEFQPTWCQSWSVSDLRWQNSQANVLHSLMHASRTEVESELHQVQVELQELRQERDVLKVRVLHQISSQPRKQIS